MKWLIEDPNGSIHTIEKDHQELWWGFENLAHGVPEPSARTVIKHGIQRSLESFNDHGIWGKYTWLRIPE